MSKVSAKRPVLIRRINFIWYPLTLIPILALLYLSLTGVLDGFIVMLSLFAAVFWLCSLGFATWSRFRKRPELRQ